MGRCVGPDTVMVIEDIHMTLDEPAIQEWLLEDKRPEVFRGIYELLARSLRPPDRPQRLGSHKIVTPTPENMGIISVRVAEGRHDRCLPDAGLAANHHYPSHTPECISQQSLETFENRISLQQLHSTNATSLQTPDEWVWLAVPDRFGPTVPEAPIECRRLTASGCRSHSHSSSTFGRTGRG